MNQSDPNSTMEECHKGFAAVAQIAELIMTS